jgi:uncharacterized Tic20 family protein
MVDMSTGEPLAQSQDERTWGMLCHLSALAGLLTGGIGFVLGPLIVWLIKKDQYKFVDDQGRESVNFQISMLIYMVVSALLMIVGIGFILLPILVVVDVVLVIMASVAASDGKAYKYPFTIRLIK